MKQLISIFLFLLLLSGCSAARIEGPTETKTLLVQYAYTSYLYMDGIDDVTESNWEFLVRYDRNGNRIEERRYEHDEITSRTTYTYDDQGKQTRCIHYSYVFGIPYPTNYTKFTYDTQGRQ